MNSTNTPSQAPLRLCRNSRQKMGLVALAIALSVGSTAAYASLPNGGHAPASQKSNETRQTAPAAESNIKLANTITRIEYYCYDPITRSKIGGSVSHQANARNICNYFNRKNNRRGSQLAYVRSNRY
ncbi:MAG: hypothetical protein AAF296_02925 [Pseudomonadota bacterium]